MSHRFRDRVNRDKPRLSDRFRGKSGAEIVEELRKDFAKRKQMFFDTAPRTSSFMKSGFPFDDHTHWRSRDTDLRSRLDEIAQRYPQFADQLRDWTDEESPSGMGWGSKPAAQQSTQAAGPANQTEIPPEQAAPQQSGGEGDARSQRAMSAPPDNRAKEQPQRFVSRLEINPNTTSDSTQPSQQQQPPQPQQTQAEQKRKPANVRHIPIFVEGRNETVMPKEVDTTTADFGHSFGSPPRDRDRDRDSTDGFHGPAYAQYAPPGFGFMKSPWSQRRSPFMSKETMGPHQHQSHQHHPQPHQHQGHHQAQQQHYHTQPQQQPQHYHTQQQQPQQQQHYHTQQQQPQQQQQYQHHQQHQQPAQQQQTEPPRQQTPPRQPPKAEPPKPKDPLQEVAAVQKDVDELMKQVETFNGRRQDKQYIYLDEMLTRNLLKLDLVETEGKENVRAARKETIRCIQKCISILESKAMTPEEIAEREKAMEVEVDPTSEVQPMEVVTDSQGDAADTTAEAKPEEPAPVPAPVPSPAPESSDPPAPAPAPAPVPAPAPAPVPVPAEDPSPAPMDTTADPATTPAVATPAVATPAVATPAEPTSTSTSTSTSVEQVPEETAVASAASSEATPQSAADAEASIPATGNNEAVSASPSAAPAAAS